MTLLLTWPRKRLVTLAVPQVESLNEVFQWRASSIGTNRPLLLDLYCGAGGASMGYYRSGFDVIGIDIAPQPNYPFPMIQTDAVGWLDKYWYLLRSHENDSRGWGFDAVHASPPCQRWSKMSNCRPEIRQKYPELIDPTRDRLTMAQIPWVIENVEGAPLIHPITLCGFMFDHELYRHRLFESGGGVGARGYGRWSLTAPEHPVHGMKGSRAGHWEPGRVISVSGHCAPMWKARAEMDVSWTNREELAEAIPPYMTEYIGRQILESLVAADSLRKMPELRREAAA